MRALDWRSVLGEHGVPFIERGPNVKRGELNIRCPFCGSADPSYHMGLNLENGWWACWRNNEHRGKSPLRLLVQLLHIPYFRARQIAGLGEDYVDPDGFDAVAARVMGRDGLHKVEHVRREFLQLPRELIPIQDHGPSRRAWTYLRQRRGFSALGVFDLVREYGLCTSTAGDWKDRVVMPYVVDGELVAWTGRAIAHSTIRYKDLSLDDCLVPIKHTLYNHDCILEGGLALVVVEGPIDALKLDLYGRDHGVRAVALSTNSINPQQLYLLEAASMCFERVVVMMDNKGDYGIVDSMRMKQHLSCLPRLTICPVPYGAGDAGELTPTEAYEWAQELSRSIRSEQVQ